MGVCPSVLPSKEWFHEEQAVVDLGFLFASGVIWLLLRRVDGSGHVEDMASRLLVLGVMGVLFACFVIVELVVYFTMQWIRRASH